MGATQKNRFIAIKFEKLGDDDLLLRSFTATEQLGRLYQVEADVIREVDELGEVEFDDIIGAAATIRLDLPAGGPRNFSGIVSRFVQTEVDGAVSIYRATIVPWLWLLTRTADCRIYQNMTVPEILEDVFQRHGGEFEARLTSSYDKWDYCVQYRETDFNFVSRLMEQEGIYYFFDHQVEPGKSKMILVDAKDTHEPFEENETIPYRAGVHEGGERSEAVSDWMIEQEVQPGTYVLNDFNFETPSLSLKADDVITRNYTEADHEIYDYPGEYEKREEGSNYAKVRIQELQVQYEVLRGETNARWIATGCLFELEDHPRDEQNRKCLVTSASLQASAGDFDSDSGEGSEESFACSFTAMDAEEQFRPPRVTSKPVIQGVQTAIVVGPSGAEIHTDKHARVKVQFHWDRYGNYDENSSCWIRVSQSNAGKGWGSMITPRIGQEVIVEFLEGDPDRPIITGRVYNAEQPPPYAGGDGVVSGLKSNTHKGSGYNEMSMDDTAGKEKITIHSQYDMGTTVEHDDTQTVHNDRTISVDGKHTETIKKDTTIKITEGKLVHDVVAGTAKYHVQGAVSEDFDDKQETIVNKDIIITSESTKIHVTAATEIQLQVGASKLLMKSDGSIELSGNNVAIKGSQTVQIKGTSITSQADADNNTKGAIVLSEGSATNTVKGGMVMLNP